MLTGDASGHEAGDAAGDKGAEDDPGENVFLLRTHSRQDSQLDSDTRQVTEPTQRVRRQHLSPSLKQEDR